jgi:hypothetical protein
MNTSLNGEGPSQSPLYQKLLNSKPPQQLDSLLQQKNLKNLPDKEKTIEANKSENTTKSPPKDDDMKVVLSNTLTSPI